MKHRVHPSCSLVVIVSFILAITFPQSLSAGSLEDNFKTAGIVVGITFGVGLVVVLVVAAVVAIKGDQGVFWSQVSVEEPVELTFYGISIPLWEGLTLMEPFSAQEGAVNYRGDYLLMGRSYLDGQGKATSFLMDSISLFPGLDTRTGDLNCPMAESGIPPTQDGNQPPSHIGPCT